MLPIAYRSHQSQRPLIIPKNFSRQYLYNCELEHVRSIYCLDDSQLRHGPFSVPPSHSGWYPPGPKVLQDASILLCRSVFRLSDRFCHPYHPDSHNLEASHATFTQVWGDGSITPWKLVRTDELPCIPARLTLGRTVACSITRLVEFVYAGRRIAAGSSDYTCKSIGNIAPGYPHR